MNKNIDNEKEKSNLNIEKEVVSNKPKHNSQNKQVEDEPSWYHYVIVLILFFGFFAGIYYFAFGNENSQDNQGNIYLKNNTYIYKHVVGNKTFNIEFENSLYKLDNYDMENQVNVEDIWSSNNIYLSFDIYNGTDNKYVSTTSVKIMKLFKYLYGFDIGTENILDYSNYTCLNSTIDNKIITFNPYSNRDGVYYNSSNGCIQIESINVEDFILVGDKFLYGLVKE